VGYLLTTVMMMTLMMTTTKAVAKVPPQSCLLDRLHWNTAISISSSTAR